MNEREPDQSTIPTYVQDYLESNGFIIRPELGEKIIFEPGRTDMILVQKTETGNKKYTSIKIPTALNETKSVIEEPPLETDEPIIEKLESLPTIPEKIDVSMVTTDESPSEITHPSDTETNQDSLESTILSENNRAVENMIIEPELKDSEIINSGTEKLDFDLLASLTQADTKPKPDVAGTPKPEPKPRESTHSSNNQDFWTQKLGFTTTETNHNEQEIATTQEPEPPVPAIEPEIIDQKSPEISPEQSDKIEPVEPTINESEKIEQIPIENPIINEQSIEHTKGTSYVFVTSALVKAIKSFTPKTPDIANSPVIPTSNNEAKAPDPVINPVVEPVILEKTPDEQPVDLGNLSLNDYGRLFSQHTPNPTTSTTQKVDPSSLF